MWEVGRPLQANQLYAQVVDSRLYRRECGVCCAGTESFILIGPSGSNSAVECDLAKVEVAGSIPVSRSSFFEALHMRGLFVFSVSF
jgi:hypothetical protein